MDRLDQKGAEEEEVDDDDHEEEEDIEEEEEADGDAQDGPNAFRVTFLFQFSPPGEESMIKCNSHDAFKMGSEENEKWRRQT